MTTRRVTDHSSKRLGVRVADVGMVCAVVFQRQGRLYSARTVYLSEHHLREVDHIIETWQQVDSKKRLTRSAVLRRAIEHLHDAVEADPAKCTLEND